MAVVTLRVKQESQRRLRAARRNPLDKYRREDLAIVYKTNQHIKMKIQTKRHVTADLCLCIYSLVCHHSIQSGPRVHCGNEWGKDLDNLV
ncbi:hypothetical protein AMECASPLE_012631 [Ameca splendens]|uniref:Uncharacterized protein n=1 Tax=Ameca splendens TaxID=208324 RepID=A0ABV0Y101_9TELE